VEVGGLVLPKLHGWRARRIVEPPAFPRDVRAHRTIEEDHLAEWPRVRDLRPWVDAREKHVRNAVDRREPAIDIDVSLRALPVSDLRIVARGERLQFAALKKTRAATPHEIDVTLDEAVGDEQRAIPEQGVLVARQVDAIKNHPLAV